MTDQSAEEEQQKNECPICGQPYDHKREESSEITRTGPQLRADATSCKTADFGTGKRKVFVHVD